MERTCKMEGCKREYRAKGYCNVHYKKWRRGELDKKPRYKICSEENCKGETYKSGRCKPHYDAWIASRKKVEAEVVATPAVEAAPAVE
ncbi:hypothetical protein KKA47_05460, partial [bacterium]|nr:hypothetical protein [bacterium]